MRSSLAGLALGLALASCGPTRPPLNLAEGCQPLLGGFDCLLPYPSDFFRNGEQVQLAATAVPTTKAGRPADVTVFKRIDGFSRVPTIVAVLGLEVSSEGFVRLEDGGDLSLAAATSRSLLLEAETKQPVAHWADLDPRATDRARQAIVLHPFVGLKPGTRYVALLHGVKTPAGALAPAPEGFRRLRDRESGGDQQLEPLQKAYDARVFPVAEAAGVPRKELQLAWEFTTGSDDWSTGDLLRIRELTQAWLSANTPTVTVTSVDELPMDKPDVFRLIKGTVHGPLFVDSPNPNSKLVRGADGQVKQAGEVDFPFTAIIPVAVRDAVAPSGTFLYGHGFFGNLGELEGTAPRQIATRASRTLVGTEWWGMHISDVASVGDALTSHPGTAMQFVERTHQGIANWLVLTAAVQQMKALPQFQRVGGGALLAGEADCFIGISMGHILGGTMNAVNPVTRRVALQVGGAGLSGMFMRARPFSGYFALLDLAISDPLEQQKYLATLQRPLDRIDPASYAQFFFDAPLAGNAPKQVLMQTGVMDSEVPNLGPFLHARLLGLKLVTPSTQAPWGIAAAGAGPLSSGLTLYDFKLGDPVEYYRLADFAPDGNQVHDGVRRLTAAQEQLVEFWRDGVVTNHCSGACDPE